jgi:hypothetical protein
MATTFTKIASVTVGVLGAATMDFTSIPSTYTDLCIKISARSLRASNSDAIYIVFNGSGGTAYSDKTLRGDGASATSFSSSAAALVAIGRDPAATSTASTFGNVEVYIPNYAGSNYKSLSTDAVTENNATTAYAELVAGLWSNTAAITSISIQDGNSSTFVQYSTATLYGISKS